MSRVLGAAFLLAMAYAGQAGAGELTFSTPAGQRIDLAQLITRVRSARFLMLGEVHGSYRHHDIQIRILTALLEAGIPLAAGLEAFPAASSHKLSRWVAGELDSAPLYRLFDKDWSLENWAAYRDLLFFLRDRRVPSVGINADEEVISRVARQGIAALSADEARALPVGKCVADERYLALMASIIGTGALHDRVFRNFCEAQLLSDAIMARSLEGTGRLNPRRLVVGLAGLYHAWKPAVPEQLKRLGAGPVVVILPEEWPRSTESGLDAEVDYLWHWRE